MNTTRVQRYVTNVYERNIASSAKIRLNRGGTRSSKTYSISQVLVDWLLTGRIGSFELKKGKASIVRKGLDTLKATVLNDVKDILSTLNLAGVIYHHKTDKYFKVGERVLEYFSIDDAQKVRSRGRNILFACEANELNYKEFIQLLLRTTDLTFVDFNPDDPYHWLNTEIEQKRAKELNDVDVIVSTYRDNFTLTKEQIKEIEYLEHIDPVLWQVYGLGQYGVTGEVIFPNLNIVEQMPPALSKRGYGVDFGYVIDPTALYYCGLQGSKIYVDELIYSSGLLSGELHEMMLQNKVSRRRPVIADSASPEYIAELKARGWNIHPATKGPGSVNYRIGLLKQYELHATARSKGIIQEQFKYKWKVDKSGNVMNVPNDAFNHAFDAVGYWANAMLKPRARVGKYRAEVI